MASYVPVIKNGASGAILYVGLVAQANTLILKANPTLASGDFKVSIDGAAFANLGTLPTVTPAAGTSVKITLAQSEVNGDNIVIACIDAAGAEWCDLFINIQTTARQVDDLAYPATTGRSMVVDAAGLVDANAVKHGPSGSGTAQTARDIGASVLLSTGTGTGQLDFTAGVVKANLAQILATALTETAGLLAGGFKKFFNIATPAATMDAGVLVATVTNLTNAPTAGDLTATMKTSVTTAATAATPIAASVSGAVASVTGLTASDVGAIKTKTDSLTFTSALKVDANALALNGDSTSAANIAKTTLAIGRGTASGVPTTTNIPTSAFTPSGAAADQFKGRIITFDANTATTALRGQATDITASSNAAAPVFTVTALTTAPAAGDTFSVT